MLLGILKNDIEFDYRTDDPYGGTIDVILRKGDIVKLSNPRIIYFDTTCYDGEDMDNLYDGVILNISENEVDIINTTWKKIK